MPVSHLGLTVSHIPSATSFYLAALQPLGYRFIGHQGNSIGFGVDSADFFLTQAPIGTRPSPNHIAFLADNRNVVRDCYTASLNAGGLPSGAPSYRNDDCSCFNAAVEDHDGNTVEFIYRQPHGEGEGCGEADPSKSRVMAWQQDIAENGVPADAQSAAQSIMSKGSQASTITRAKSRMATALDLAKSVKSEAPSLGISRSNTAPASSSFPSKAIIGTALGAAAGAALMFAMTREESRNAKEESDHRSHMSSRSKGKSRELTEEPRSMPPPARAETMPPSMPAHSQAPKPAFVDSRSFHRNYSTTDSAYSRPYPRFAQAMRMLEATGHNNDDDVPEVMSRYTNLRPHPTRTRSIDAIDEYAPEYGPRSQAGRSIKRAGTLPVDVDDARPVYYLEAPKSTTSRHSSRYEDRDDKRSSTSRRSHRGTSVDDTERLKRHDSGVSMHSSRSRRDRGSEAGCRSSTSTIKPARRGPTQDAIPLPPPPIGDNAPSHAPSRGGSSCYHPAAIQLPPSITGSKHSTRDRDPVLDPSPRARPIPRHIHEERDSVLQSWEDFEASEESDGLGDTKTVLPEDSISCVDLSKPRRRHRSSREKKKEGESRYSSRRSEATVRPKERKGNLLGLPIRSKDESRVKFT